MDLETNVKLNKWVEGLSEEGKTQHELMKAWSENKSDQEDMFGSEVVYKTTNEIIDELFDMGHLDMTFVQTWMRLAGFRIVNSGGLCKWRMWLIME